MYYYPVNIAKCGNEVVMVARKGGDASEYREHGIKVYEIDDNTLWIKAVRTICKHELPDMVHVFLYSGCGLIPWLTRFDHQVKYALDIRSPLLRTGVLYFIHRIKNWFETPGFDAIFTHGIESGWTQLGKRDDFIWLPPGVDFSTIPVLIDNKQSSTESDRLKLVYIGSLHSYRQIDRLIEAVWIATGKVNVKLDVFGDGSETGYLQDLINKYEL